MAKYQVIRDTTFHKAGEIVYDSPCHDYGLSSDDTRFTGIEHISVVSQLEGNEGSRTIPKNALKVID